MLSRRRKIVFGLAATTASLVTSCSNGQHLKDEREQARTTIETGINDMTEDNASKEIDRLTALINDYKSSDISSSVSSQERRVFQRQLDELFSSCTRAYEKSSPSEQNTITESLASLFSANQFINDYAYRKHSTGICGAQPKNPLQR